MRPCADTMPICSSEAVFCLNLYQMEVLLTSTMCRTVPLCGYAFMLCVSMCRMVSPYRCHVTPSCDLCSCSSVVCGFVANSTTLLLSLVALPLCTRGLCCLVAGAASSWVLKRCVLCLLLEVRLCACWGLCFALKRCYVLCFIAIALCFCYLLATT